MSLKPKIYAHFRKNFLWPLASVAICTALIFLAEKNEFRVRTQNNSFHSSVFGDHHILLNLNQKADLKIHEALSFTNYSCLKIGPKQVRCSLFSVNLPQTQPSFSIKSQDEDLFIGHGEGGVTHLSIKNNSTEKISLYSFTSAKELQHFTNKNPRLFSGSVSKRDLEIIEQRL